MTMEWTLQLPVIAWTPKLALNQKTAKRELAEQAKLEEMSLGELLFVAVGPAR